MNLIKLRSITSEIEFGMIKAILDDSNIPYIVRDHGPGGHMRIIGGSSIFGTDILVDEANFDKANSLLESICID
jgi:hypothetical protein